jgi:hypothetical protein
MHASLVAIGLQSVRLYAPCVPPQQQAAISSEAAGRRAATEATEVSDGHVTVADLVAARRPLRRCVSCVLRETSGARLASAKPALVLVSFAGKIDDPAIAPRSGVALLPELEPHLHAHACLRSTRGGPSVEDPSMRGMD